jgi:hypothetical protein
MGKRFRIIASEKDTVDMDLYKTNKHTHTHTHTHTHKMMFLIFHH